jgi:hypothetical protein
MPAAPSNKAIGGENHRRLVEFLERVGDDVPRKPNGDGDIAAIVRGAGLADRQAIYQNKRNRNLLNERFARLGIPEIGAAKIIESGDRYERPAAVSVVDEETRLRRRIADLEREVVVARGEIVELRRKMRRYEAIEIHLAETGRLPR